jgi:hypothetical protein
MPKAPELHPEELSRTRPPFEPQLEEAEELLADFGRVWTLEDDPAKRRRLIASLFDRVWQDGGAIVAVKPREAFLRYFKTADQLARRRERSAVSKAGATGLEPATSGVTGHFGGSLGGRRRAGDPSDHAAFPAVLERFARLSGAVPGACCPIAARGAPLESCVHPLCARQARP